MPKRKRSRGDDDDFYYLQKKLRKLERKVRDSRSSKYKRDRRSRRRSRTRSHTRSRSDTRSRSWSASSQESRSRSPYKRHKPEAEVAQELVLSYENEHVLPSTSHEVEPVPESVVEPAPADVTAPELDDAILEILGDDPTLIKTFGSDIQKDLAVRLEHCATSGLSREARKEFKEKYLTPNNCKLINAPTLNAEIKAAVSEAVAKRDKAIEIKQSQLASAIAALSQALTRLLSASEKDSELIKLLIDTSRILCDCQHADSITRRSFVLSTLKKDMKDQLQNTKVDNFLFGENFAETIKTARAINKSGAELKAAPTSKVQSLIRKPIPGPSNKNLNWKGPFPTRRQPEAQRTKEPATAKNRPSSSSRPSQHRQMRGGRR